MAFNFFKNKKGKVLKIACFVLVITFLLLTLVSAGKDLLGNDSEKKDQPESNQILWNKELGT